MRDGVAAQFHSAAAGELANIVLRQAPILLPAISAESGPIPKSVQSCCALVLGHRFEPAIELNEDAVAVRGRLVLECPPTAMTVGIRVGVDGVISQADTPTRAAEFPFEDPWQVPRLEENPFELVPPKHGVCFPPCDEEQCRRCAISLHNRSSGLHVVG